MAKGWKQTFDDPIPLPGGRQLVTLQAAGNYIAKLPKAEHLAPEWQTATQALILAAGGRGPTMDARIGILRALNRNVIRNLTPSPKGTHLGKLKPKRDE